MIGSKQTNYALIQVKQRLLFLKQKQKNYKTSHFQIKWSKNSVVFKILEYNNTR